MNTKELLEKRAEAANAMVELRNKIQQEKRSFSAEERANFDKASDAYDNFTDQIEAIQRADNVERDMRNTPGREDTPNRQNQNAEINDEIRSLAFSGMIRSKLIGELTNEEQRAMQSLGFNPNAKEFRFTFPNYYPQTLKEARDLSIGVPSLGGYTVPEDFRRELEIAKLKYGTMLNLATKFKTTTGSDMPAPTLNDTDNEAVVVSEAGNVGGGADPTFGEEVFKAHKYTSKFIKISMELLEDSAFNLPATLGKVIGERIGRGCNRDFTIGDGNGKAKGIVTSATGIQTEGVGAFIADDLIDLVYEIDEEYDDNAVLMLHKKILKIIRKFKDSNGQYLWVPGYSEKERGTVLGYPVYKNSKMDSTVATGANIAVFGDFSKYMVREVNEIRMKRLTELYAENDQEGFGAFFRVDGKLLDAGTHPVYKLTVQ